MSELRCWHFHFSFSFVGDFDTILIKLKVNQNETTAAAVEREEHQIVDEKIRSLPLLFFFMPSIDKNSTRRWNWFHKKIIVCYMENLEIYVEMQL